MANELDRLLSSWTERHDIELTPSDEKGCYFLVFDGRYEVAFSQLGDKIVLETELAELPTKPQEAADLLEKLMSLQLAQAEKSRAVLTLEEDQRSLSMFRVIKASHATALKFERTIGDFVNAVAFFDSQIEPTGPAFAPDITAGTPGQFFI